MTTPIGDWTTEMDLGSCAQEDDLFLNSVESALPENLRRTGKHQVGGCVLDRLIKMADARPVLRRIEWSGEGHACPVCGEFKPGTPNRINLNRDGHDPECELAHVLEA